MNGVKSFSFKPEHVSKCHVIVKNLVGVHQLSSVQCRRPNPRTSPGLEEQRLLSEQRWRSTCSFLSHQEFKWPPVTMAQRQQIRMGSGPSFRLRHQCVQLSLEQQGQQYNGRKQYQVDSALREQITTPMILAKHEHMHKAKKPFCAPCVPKALPIRVASSYT